MLKKRYNSINDWLWARFGERVYKVSLESGLSCPNRDGTVGSGGCTFCNFESYRPATNVEAQSSKVKGERKGIKEQLEEGIAYIKRRHRVNKVISYFQSGSNTHAPASKLAPLFYDAISHPQVVGLAISTRPDCIDEGHMELFKELSQKTLLWIELGLQSAHDVTLEKINRGHSALDFTRACKILEDIDILVCAHVILGLPGETKQMMIETARFLNNTGVWGVKIHNLHVLKDTSLEQMYKAGGVEIPPLETYAGWVADFLEALSLEVVIHRVNSHSPRSLTVAPKWSINKLAIFGAVESEMKQRNTFQGCSKCLLCPQALDKIPP